jgi:S1-C subfamily serine protease
MKSTIVALSGSLRGKTCYFDQDFISVGTDLDQDIRFDAREEPGVGLFHAFIEFRDCDFILHAAGGSQVFVNGNQVLEVILKDEDLIELGAGGPKLRFRLRPEDQAQCKPMRHILADSKDLADHRGAGRLVSTTTFLKYFLHQCLFHARTSVRCLTYGLIGFFFVAIAALAVQGVVQRGQISALQRQLFFERRARDELLQRVNQERLRWQGMEKRSLEVEQTIASLRQEASELRGRLAQEQNAGRSKEEQVVRLSEELKETTRKVRSLEQAMSTAERIITRFGDGVSFIQGRYTFIDPKTQKPLRLVGLNDRGEPLRDRVGKIRVAVEGNGPEVSQEYSGSGFLASAAGRIVTSRHVAEPWLGNEDDKLLMHKGYTPQRLGLRAFFPKHRTPFPLNLEKVSDRADVALVQAQLPPKHRIPVLELDHTGKGAVTGQPVFLIGYPTGLDAILAKSDERTVREIVETKKGDGFAIAEEISLRGMIRPSLTQGHFVDVLQERIVYDAPTTGGGSGGPLLNISGKVVGVNFAVLSSFAGSNFGIPIHYATGLLRNNQTVSGRSK